MLGLGEAAYLGSGEQGPSSGDRNRGETRGQRSAAATDAGTCTMWCVRVCVSATFVLIGAASTHVVEDGEVGGRDGVGTATAVAMVTAQAAP